MKIRRVLSIIILVLGLLILVFGITEFIYSNFAIAGLIEGFTLGGFFILASFALREVEGLDERDVLIRYKSLKFSWIVTLVIMALIFFLTNPLKIPIGNIQQGLIIIMLSMLISYFAAVIYYKKKIS